MKGINPAYKLIGILIPIVIIAFVYNTVLNFAIVAVCMATLALSRANWKNVLKVLIPVLILSVGMYMTGYKFHDGSNVGVGAATASLISGGAVGNGLQLASRVLAFGSLGMLFVFTTDTMELVRSLEQQLHMPVKFVYGLLASFQLLPNISHEYKKTKAAFRARGLYPAAISPSLLTPLMVKAVRWSEALAAAMESQGFDDQAKRTCYRPLVLRPADRLFPVITTGLLIIGIVLL